MDQARQQALAGAVLAGNEYARIGCGYATRDIEYPLHLRRFANDVRIADPPQQRILGLQLSAAAECSTQLELVPNDGNEPRVFPGFFEKVTRASAHRLDRDID